MDIAQVLAFVTKAVEESALPALMDFARVPNLSPAYDPQWASNGLQEAALAVLRSWTLQQHIPGLVWDEVRLEGCPALVYVEVPGSATDSRTVLVYGHVDKQPGLEGWLHFCGPTHPATRDGKLYGRGVADDGYCLFAALLAVKCCMHLAASHSRCVLVLETEEESGSTHFPRYLDTLTARIGTPQLVLCLDSNILSYDRLWITDSMRGSVAMDVKVEVLKKGVHSGDSGIVPSSFRILRSLIGRLEDPNTGRIREEGLYATLPASFYQTYAEVAATVGESWLSTYPLCASPLHRDTTELLLNQTWRPALTITGLGGLPASAGNVLRAFSSARIAVRLPPTVPPQAALETIETALTTSPPYNAAVSIERRTAAAGWVAPALSVQTERKLQQVSELVFAKKALRAGAGGTIPALVALSRAFPSSEFVVTGVLGPHSNAHCPNEALDIAYFARLTACVAFILEEFSC